MYIKARELIKGKRVVLASKSPRRRELLHLLTDDFEVIPAVGEESAPEDIRVEEIPILLADQKCREVAESCAPDDDTIVIGCDTVVISGGRVLGKPADEQDALRMLTELSGCTHMVISGLSVYCRGKYHTGAGLASVTFYPADEQQLKAYIATGEPMDKAGAYGIQGIGGLLVMGINGDYNSVVGLPVNELSRIITEILADE
ncbi:MAG: septum formation protein Maf [Ruminococcus sp.]|nr:septum formation protein Maf [Ruminococcus sp.]